MYYRPMSAAKRPRVAPVDLLIVVCNPTKNPKFTLLKAKEELMAAMEREVEQIIGEDQLKQLKFKIHFEYIKKTKTVEECWAALPEEIQAFFDVMRVLALDLVGLVDAQLAAAVVAQGEGQLIRGVSKLLPMPSSQ